MPQLASQSTPSNGTKPQLLSLQRLLLLLLAAIIIILTIITGNLFSKPKNNIKTENKKSSQNSPLDNPLIQQMTEKLPIPKITMIPITLPPISPSQINPQTSNPNNPLPSSWKTYKNASRNFSLSYPSELITQENSHGLGITDITFINTNSHPQNSLKYQILIYPRTIGNLIGQSFDQFYALPPQTTYLITTDSSSPQQVTKIENIKINYLRGLTFRTTSDPPSPTEETEIGVYIELKDNIFIISTGESNKTILDYMLSTFKSSL